MGVAKTLLTDPAEGTVPPRGDAAAAAVVVVLVVVVVVVCAVEGMVVGVGVGEEGVGPAAEAAVAGVRGVLQR